MAGEANVWNPRTLIETSADTKRIEEKFTALVNQTFFTLIDFAYALNSGSLAVYRNGLFLKEGIDWVENTDTTFSRIVPSTAADVIVAVGHVAITANVDVRDTDIFVTNYQAIRDYAGTEITLDIDAIVNAVFVSVGMEPITTSLRTVTAPGTVLVSEGIDEIATCLSTVTTPGTVLTTSAGNPRSYSLK